jgi:hypothetical protein
VALPTLLLCTYFTYTTERHVQLLGLKSNNESLMALLLLVLGEGANVGDVPVMVLTSISDITILEMVPPNVLDIITPEMVPTSIPNITGTPFSS